MAEKMPDHCSFCKRDRKDVNRLIAGSEGVYICDKCVYVCLKNLAAIQDIDFGILRVENDEFSIIFAGQMKKMKLVALNDLEATALWRELTFFLVRASETGKKDEKK